MVDEEECVRRMEMMESDMRPRIVPLGFRHADTDKLEQARRKTIAQVEIGKAETKVDFGFTRDAVALHFADGSSLIITPMPMVGNLEDEGQKLDWTKLNVHLDVDFLPSGRLPIANELKAGSSRTKHGTGRVPGRDGGGRKRAARKTKKGTKRSGKRPKDKSPGRRRQAR